MSFPCSCRWAWVRGGGTDREFVFKAVSQCNLFGGGTHLTIAGESSPFHSSFRFSVQFWVIFLCFLFWPGLRLKICGICRFCPFCLTLIAFPHPLLSDVWSGLQATVPVDLNPQLTMALASPREPSLDSGMVSYPLSISGLLETRRIEG